ncbi:DUF2786 domain-containing protein [Pandoraea apista]|uniref:Uncharacterized protein n=1 Tax=Pandoraea apista TaxID=93218 RepID=A0A5E5P8S0_9BURK|nr:DUF2786 domain-containing protein [Pandoraea apista]AJF00058.1 hypothetical protein SG18_21095 [Pandoraea apista]AKH74213.1 hypothetical protein XM39_21280 [Pandoraea apista]AKI62762.1 hypothetical protein AA956_14595 [Pandoraea apista]VVG72109.1 hypothetical protein PAP18089_03102 [Pandoraea apista]
MERNTAIDKIKKCLALGKSNNPHEAASAMRQAQKMMAAYGVSDDELLAAGVTEYWEKSGANRTPARYEAALARMIAKAFGCDLVFTQRLYGPRSIKGGYAFVGVAPASQVACYSYGVLFRQLRRARAEFISTTLKRCGPRNKTARADVFCEGWVMSVRELVIPVELPESHSQAVAAYMRTNYAVTESMNPRQRVPGRHAYGAGDYTHGARTGRRATLHRGVGASVNTQQLLEK